MTDTTIETPGEARANQTIKSRVEMPTSRKMQCEIEAAKILREQLADLCADDPEFLRDSIEGQTNVRELIAVLVAEEGEDLAILAGIKEYTEKIVARYDRLTKRVELRRSLLVAALQIAELTKLETPSGTISLKTVPPKTIVTEESEIPARFWKASAPKLDMRALTEALKDAAKYREEAEALSDEAERREALGAAPTIPGATLSNGGQTISIRRR